MSATTDKSSLIELRNVSKRFAKSVDLAVRIAVKFGAKFREEIVHALADVNMQIAKGEVIGLAGESGCGKSTVGRIMAGLLKPSNGAVLYRDHDISCMDKIETKKTALKIQMIFQDPFSSLNPRMRVKKLIGEAPMIHGIIRASELNDYLDDLMLRCGLDPSYKQRYPHQFSGGQRQRIAIARALAVQPEVIICDEVVSALDVSIQAQILNMLMDLRMKLGLTALFISHNLGVIEHVSDSVIIMYLGRLVEKAKTEDLFLSPLHPYTQALLNGLTSFDKRRINFLPVEGEIPSPFNPPSGCHFHPRCQIAVKQCREERPLLREVATNRLVACHRI